MTVTNLTKEIIEKFIPSRENNSRKGDNGKVLIVGGSYIYHGAPALSSLAALRSGSDLVYTCVPKINAFSTRSISPDLIVIPMADSKLTRGTVNKLLGQVPVDIDSVAIGMGLAIQDIEAIKLLVKSLLDRNVRVSLDASSLIKEILPIIEGQNVVNAIEQNDIILAVSIIREGDAAKAFDAAKIFESEQAKQKEIAAAKAKEMEEKIAKMSEGATTTSSGLKYIIQEQGDGDKPHAGDRVSVHYSGYLLDGTKFDSSYDRKKPFEFSLGQGRVIKGWDEGVALLNIGTKAKFFIPANLAYGSRGAGGVIPPNATLIFEVELLDIVPGHDHGDPNHTH